jgi:hypothetical protein
MPSRQFPGVQFFGSRDRRVRSFMVLCENHASSAAPRRNCGRCCERAEAAGRKLEFEMSDFLRLIALAAFPVVPSRSMASS